MSNPNSTSYIIMMNLALQLSQKSPETLTELEKNFLDKWSASRK